MQKKISLKWSLFFGVAGIVFYAVIILFLTFDPSVRSSYAKSIPPVASDNPQGSAENKLIISTEDTRPGLPVRLKITKINVDAEVEYIDLTPGGEVGVPAGAANAAWFNLGPRPGESGSAVIAGHYGWKDGRPSVFDGLYKLRKGDKLYVEDDQGVTISFVVRESRRYDPNADAKDVFGLSDGRPHLNLVTCEGDWDEISESYSKRLVVFADKE